MKRINLPNKLTLLRIILVPAVVATILIEFPFHMTVAGLLFGAAAITDALDGNIARKNNLITDFGKFADPLADKILIISVLICFLKIGLCGTVPIIIIIFREFAITSMRLVASAKGKVVAANMLGKVKTVAQMIAIIAIFLMQTTMDIISTVSPLGHTIPIRFFINKMYVYANYSLYDSLANIFNIFNIIGQSMIWIVAIITVISGIKYIVDNKGIINEMA